MTETGTWRTEFVFSHRGTGGILITPGEIPNPPISEFTPEELRCEYCGRKHGRGKETCSGCGAPL